MEIPIIKIGNSKGLRLSKTLLEKYQIEDKVELVMEEDVLIIRPIKKARKNWNQAFQQMNQAGDDQLLIDDVFGDESFEE
jgi:antitoxin MazE